MDLALSFKHHFPGAQITPGGRSFELKFGKTGLFFAQTYIGYGFVTPPYLAASPLSQYLEKTTEVAFGPVQCGSDYSSECVTLLSV